MDVSEAINIIDRDLGEGSEVADAIYYLIKSDPKLQAVVSSVILTHAASRAASMDHILFDELLELSQRMVRIVDAYQAITHNKG